MTRSMKTVSDARPMVNKVIATIIAGTVGLGSVPSSPIVMGNPATLLVMTTPMAPAVPALRTLVLKEQLPRSMRATLPLTPEIAVQPLLGVETARSPVMSPVSERFGGKAASVAASMPAMAGGELTTRPLITAALSTDAATLRARAEEAGELVM